MRPESPAIRPRLGIEFTEKEQNLPLNRSRIHRVLPLVLPLVLIESLPIMAEESDRILAESGQ